MREEFKGMSFWLDSLPEPVTLRPGLTGVEEADIAIIGAGYCGLWTAYYLKQAQPSLSITVLESHFAGRGAAGRNGGWCSLNLPQFERLANSQKTRRQAKQIAPFLFDMVDEVGRVVADEGIECDFHKGGVVHAAVTDSQVNYGQQTVRTYTELGFPEAQLWLDKTEMAEHVRMRGNRGGTYSPHCAVVQPAKLVLGLAHTVERLGVKIYEQSPVTEMLESGGAKTALGEVPAKATIVATEGYSGRVFSRRRRLLPIHAFQIATEPLPDHVFDEIGLADRPAFADLRLLVSYGQRTADNRITLGYGARAYRDARARDHFNPNNEEFQAISNILTDLFPVLADAQIEQCWGGPVGCSRNQRAFVQYDSKSGFGWVGGLFGNGVALSNLTGRIMSDLVLGRDTELTNLELLVQRGGDPRRDFRPWEPGPVAWMGAQSVFKKLRTMDRIDTGI